jgi:STE24 endopeptidase
MNESKATRFQRGRRRGRIVGVVLSGGLLLALAAAPAATGLAGWAARAGQGWPRPLGSAIALGVYALGVAFSWRVIWWPSAWYASPRPDGTPRGRGEIVRGALAEHVQELAVVSMIAFAGGAAVQVAAALAGPWWWAVAGALVASAFLAAMHVGPGLIARASGARPVERPALVERLGALARQVRVPIESVDELPASATVTSTALVAGAGGARRVFIAHELMRDWSDDEIAVVVAHEFAHHAHHDLWRTLGVDVGAWSVGLWAAAGALKMTGAAADGVPADLPALPAVALVAGAVWLVTAPVRHALSRRQERQADVFALQLTKRADAFQTAIRRLTAQHLAEERPSRLTRWFFHRHPTPQERLQLAETFSRRA